MLRAAISTYICLGLCWYFLWTMSGRNQRRILKDVGRVLLMLALLIAVILLLTL